MPSTDDAALLGVVLRRNHPAFDAERAGSARHDVTCGGHRGLGRRARPRLEDDRGLDDVAGRPSQSCGHDTGDVARTRRGHGATPAISLPITWR